MSCRYLESVLSKHNNSKRILRCLEDVLCWLGKHLVFTVTHIFSNFQHSMWFFQQEASICRWNEVKGEHVTGLEECFKRFICMDFPDEENIFYWDITQFLLLYKLFVFHIEWIHTARNNAGIIFNSKKAPHCYIVDKKVTSAVCMFGLLCCTLMVQIK